MQMRADSVLPRSYEPCLLFYGEDEHLLGGVCRGYRSRGGGGNLLAAARLWTLVFIPSLAAYSESWAISRGLGYLHLINLGGARLPRHPRGRVYLCSVGGEGEDVSHFYRCQHYARYQRGRVERTPLGIVKRFAPFSFFSPLFFSLIRFFFCFS